MSRILVNSSGERLISGSNTLVSVVNPSTMSNVKIWHSARQMGLANNAACTNIPDYSGNGNTPTQATGANQATFKTSIQGTFPAVLFDGVNDTYSYSTLSLFQNKGYCAMICAWRLLSSSTLYLFSARDNANSAQRFSITPSTVLIGMGAKRLDAETATGLNRNITAGSTIDILTAIADYTNGRIYTRLNGKPLGDTPITSSGSTSNTTSGSITLGSNAGSSWINGYLFEQFFIDSGTISDVINLENYIRLTYGI